MNGAQQSGDQSFPYVYRWNRCDRKGHRCRVFARSRRMNSVGLEFEDGFTMVSSGNALRKFVPTPITTEMQHGR